MKISAPQILFGPHGAFAEESSGLHLARPKFEGPAKAKTDDVKEPILTVSFNFHVWMDIFIIFCGQFNYLLMNA